MSDDRGLTPAVSILLLAAITVIMAAVIGGYATGMLGKTLNSVPPQPQTQFDFVEHDTDDDGVTDEVEIIVERGDEFDGSQIYVRGGVNGEQYWQSDLGGGATGSVGSSVRYAVSDGDTVKVVFESKEGEVTKFIASYEV